MACYNPISGMRMPDGTVKFVNCNYPFEKVKVPCGQCIGCRLDYARQWATRCMLEAKDHTLNYALTLTYDDQNVKRNEYIVPETGEIISNMTLVPTDIVKFMNHLRKHWERKYNHTGIRFFCAGEYGGKTERPHYHMIVYNFPINDLVLHSKTHTGYPLYNSEEVSGRWNKGIVAINEVSWDFCAYVARYITKKYKGQGAKEYYESRMMHPEFTRMSRRPGIGRGYYEQNKYEIYENDSIVIKQGDKAREVKPSKYYDKLFDVDEKIWMEQVKGDREIKAILKMKEEIKKTDLSEKEYLDLKRRNKEESAKLLVRPIEI